MRKISFHDLPAEMFPFVIKAFPIGSEADESPNWTVEVTSPGVVTVPGAEETGERVRVVVYWPDGTQTRE
jgi:hypothetical protein